MNAHTPGPWVVHAERWVKATRGEHQGEILIAPTYWMDGGNELQNEAAANARLIAAAPELLDALKTINEWACFASEEDVSARLLALHQIGVHARAAIAKATGATL